MSRCKVVNGNVISIKMCQVKNVLLILFPVYVHILMYRVQVHDILVSRILERETLNVYLFTL